MNALVALTVAIEARSEVSADLVRQAVTATARYFEHAGLTVDDWRQIEELLKGEAPTLGVTAQAAWRKYSGD